MSRIIYSFTRDTKLEEINFKEILPDNISLYSCRNLSNNENEKIILLNNVKEFKDNEIFLGNVFPGEKLDGTFFYIRTDESCTKIQSDVVSSRSVWYYFDNKQFFVSNSQKAIILLLNSFQFNEEVIPWLLSSGTLGPGLSWDLRIKSLPPNSTLIFDKANWAIKVDHTKTEISPVERSYKEHYSELKSAIEETFEKINYDTSKWVLPLSGGYDSRAILLFLRNKDLLHSITWGLSDAKSDKNDDPYIAQKLVDHFSLSHRFYQIENSTEDVEKILNRYLTASEGRIDHISAYMDGFKVWKELSESKYHGIIRGDEGFGWGTVVNENDVRRRVGLDLLSDFDNLRILSKFGINSQSLPEAFQRKENETLEQYRDNLYYQFRIPYVLAALNEIKTPYMEISNPFLSSRIINTVKAIPDDLRTDKKLFRKIVNDISPDIPFAKYTFAALPENILKRQDIVKIMKEEFSSSSNNIFSKDFYEWLTANMSVGYNTPSRKIMSVKTIIKNILPSKLKGRIKNHVPRNMDTNLLAFRVFTIDWINRNFGKTSKASILVFNIINFISSECLIELPVF